MKKDLAEQIQALFERCPTLAGFAVRGGEEEDLFVTDIGIYARVSAEQYGEIFQEIAATLADLLTEQPEADEMLRVSCGELRRLECRFAVLGVAPAGFHHARSRMRYFEDAEAARQWLCEGLEGAAASLGDDRKAPAPDSAARSARYAISAI